MSQVNCHGVISEPVVVLANQQVTAGDTVRDCRVVPHYTIPVLQYRDTEVESVVLAVMTSRSTYDSTQPDIVSQT